MSTGIALTYLTMSNDVIKYFGGQKKLSKVLGVSQQRVSAVVKTDRWPVAWVIPMCVASGGRFKPSDLRPDIYPVCDYKI